jgi:hypothetical protein
LRAYASKETHTWIQKAADVAGLGTDAIRWIGVDQQQRMDLAALEVQYKRDVAEGYRPFLVAGTAGTVSTGAVDPLADLAAFCQERKLWFHVDGAYGAFAAGVKSAPADLLGLAAADSVAVDPHKWLSPRRSRMRASPAASCAMHFLSPVVLHPEVEVRTTTTSGLVNSRGFGHSSLVALQQALRRSLRMIRKDIALYGACTNWPQTRGTGGVPHT